MTLVAAADGSALGNPGPAGWAWVIDNERWRAGGWPRATNNQGELMAVADLLESTSHLGAEPLRILCDSKYVIDSVTRWMPGWKRKGWRKSDGKPVLNRELLERIDRAMNGRNVQFEWVKGHAGHPLNEAADLRARAAATSFQRGESPQEGPGLAGSVPLTASEAPTKHDDALFELDAKRDPLTEVVENERSLRSRAVRANRRLIDSLLHPSYRAVSVTGTLLGREHAIEVLVNSTASPQDVTVLDARELSSEIVQLVYRLNGSQNSVHTSLWQLDGDVYRLSFSQGTAVSDWP